MVLEGLLPPPQNWLAPGSSSGAGSSSAIAVGSGSQQIESSRKGISASSSSSGNSSGLLDFGNVLINDVMTLSFNVVNQSSFAVDVVLSRYILCAEVHVHKTCT